MSHIEVKRKKGESFDAMFRRFTRRESLSGKKLDVRKREYFERKPSKNKLKESANRRIEKGQKFEYLLKSGKLKEEDMRGKRRR